MGNERIRRNKDRKSKPKWEPPRIIKRFSEEELTKEMDNTDLLVHGATTGTGGPGAVRG